MFPLLNVSMAPNLSEDLIASLTEGYPGIKEVNDSILNKELISNSTEQFTELKMVLEALTPPGTPVMGPPPMMASNATEGVRAPFAKSRYIEISIIYKCSFCSYHHKIKLFMKSQCHQKQKLEEYTEILIKLHNN